MRLLSRKNPSSKNLPVLRLDRPLDLFQVRGSFLFDRAFVKRIGKRFSGNVANDYTPDYGTKAAFSKDSETCSRRTRNRVFAQDSSSSFFGMGACRSLSGRDLQPGGLDPDQECPFPAHFQECSPSESKA